MIGRLGAMYGKEENCGDLLFSGHTAFAVRQHCWHVDWLCVLCVLHAPSRRVWYHVVLHAIRVVCVPFALQVTSLLSSLSGSFLWQPRLRNLAWATASLYFGGWQAGNVAARSPCDCSLSVSPPCPPPGHTHTVLA